MTCSCEWGDRVPWDDFLPYVLPSVGDVPDVIAAHAVRLAAIEYATVTSELKATITLDAQRNVAHYRLKADDGYSISQLDYVDLGGCQYHPNRDNHGFGRCNQFTYDQSEGLLFLNPSPSCNEVRGIEVRAVVLPGQDSCFVNRMVYDRHAELLANGALMRLYRMKDADWFDMSLAREYERLWRDGMRSVRVISLKGGSSAPLVMRARRVV